MSLFLKIFLWFWAAMALMGLSLLAVLASSRDYSSLPPERGPIFEYLAFYSAGAVKSYEEGGPRSLNLFLGDIEKRTRVKAYLFEARNHLPGKSLGSSHAPGDVRDFTGKISFDAGPQIEFNVDKQRVMAAQPIISSHGAYVFCGALSLSTASPVSKKKYALLLASVVLMAGLFCYGLARYLAAPVGKIRRAAQRIAAGDLSARVEPNRLPRSHDELNSLSRDFDKMADRLESLVVAQNRLLGDVSHELRSPLTRLNLALELARRGDTAKKEAAFARIEREAGRLDELIQELLTLSRLENGLPSSKLSSELDIAQIAADVAADVDFEAQNAGRGVRVQYVGPVEGVASHGDRELLRRAIENISRNALRHTSENSRVSLALEVGPETVRLSVSDEGPGVPEDELKAIFRPFYRVEGARERTEVDRGTGLGLAIAERAVRAHGGEIAAHNRSEGGLCVEITLPTLKPSTKASASKLAKVK